MITKSPLNLISTDFAELEVNKIKSKLIIAIVSMIREKDLNRKEVAELTGMAYHSIGYVQHGNISKVSIEFLMKLYLRLGGEDTQLPQKTVEADIGTGKHLFGMDDEESSFYLKEITTNNTPYTTGDIVELNDGRVDSNMLFKLKFLSRKAYYVMLEMFVRLGLSRGWLDPMFGSSILVYIERHWEDK